ncbi:RDD family protein [Nakamurella silvestris]|nr:RDD family protein [Nakamurella silvestris]
MTAPVTGPAVTQAPAPAGIVSRGLAAVIDLFAVLLLSSVLYLGLALTSLILDPRAFSWPAFDLFFSLGAILLMSMLYLSFWWTVSGRTVGSAVMALRLVSHRGRLRWVQSIVRAFLCTIFPVGLLWVVVDRRRRSLQDIVLRTSVVYDTRH